MLRLQIKFDEGSDKRAITLNTSTKSIFLSFKILKILFKLYAGTV